ncbi:hypothetical protein NQ317_002053 [Molorchus minor]|uniref:MADF domain-containing protein n=1 Tax=Molorchus minor TaxID=1323400 RepID=A0ABQ9JDA3_9CUCU|nr:hypothetical protein NQ317_002053 [Molorchus minor]
MNTYTEKSFNVHEIRKKILLLKDQYRHEFKKAREKRRMYPEGPYNSNLWCFEMLSFLRGHVLKKRSKEEPKRTLKKICRNKRESADSLTVEESLVIKEEAASDQVLFEKSINKMHSSDVTNRLNADDIFDTIGNNVARKLRDMTNDQQKYAMVLVNDVMYHGFMENLSCSSRLSVDGNSIKTELFVFKKGHKESYIRRWLGCWDRIM